MATIRKYLVNLDAGGRIIVLRSDGAECSPEERQWVSDAITNTIKSNTPRPKLVLPEDEFGVKMAKTRQQGVEFQLDPMIHELDVMRERRALTKKRAAELLYTTSNRLTDWARGAARPHLEDIREYGALVNLVPMLIPTGLLAEVQEMKRKFNEADLERRAAAEAQLLVNDDEETDPPGQIGIVAAT